MSDAQRTTVELDKLEHKLTYCERVLDDFSLRVDKISSHKRSRKAAEEIINKVVDKVINLPFVNKTGWPDTLNLFLLSNPMHKVFEICFCHTCIFFLASSIEIQFRLIFGLMLYQLIQRKLSTVQISSGVESR